MIRLNVDRPLQQFCPTAVALFSIALSMETAAQADNKPGAIKAVAHWTFDESGDSTAIDDAGDASARIIDVVPRRGVNGLAAGFFGSLGSRVEIPLSLPQEAERFRTLFNGSFSVELWLVDEADAPDNRKNYSLFYKADAKAFTHNSLWLYRLRQDGTYSFRIQDGDDHQVVLTIPNPAGLRRPGDRKWHHLVITVDRTTRSGNPGSGKATAWIDGQQVARSIVPPGIRIDNDGPLIIGNNHHRNSPWAGAIDEVALYDQPLQPAFIAQRFKNGQDTLKQPRPRTAAIDPVDFFELKIRPLLIEKCVDCHNGEPDSESALVIMSREALLKGGDFGPAVLAGRAADSLLIQAVRKTHKELRMPPDDTEALSPAEIADLSRWINTGAVWGKPLATVSNAPSVKSPKSTAGTEIPHRDHWSFQPRRVVEPPQVEDERWSRTEIDRFVQARREQNDIPAGVPADRRTLLRRATFDLTGLPPTADEFDAFLNDPAPDLAAFTTVVDRLLASRSYGERQGRHWLDVARYADTQGDVGDIPIPTAWLYRNWVINALNRDMPFDEFVQAQIAGDILAQESSSDAEARGLVVATGFIALSQRFGNTKKDDMHLTIEDTLDTIGRGILGLTLRCARCHDHKFDPVLNTDYYRLYGIFQSTTYPWMGMSNEKSPSDLSPALPHPKLREAGRDYWKLITRYEYQINNHHRPWLKPTLDAYKAVVAKLKSAESRTVAELQKQKEELLARHKGRFRELMIHGLPWLKSEKKRLAESPPVEFVFAVSEGTPGNARLHRRGNPKTLGGEVARGFLQVLDPEPAQIPAGSGRLQLARWLTRPDHPLTARVIVNRIWQQHFGRGLVDTPDNFGRQGSPPTHPALLDWLAEQFVQDGWSLKSLHRRMMLTETYRLSSDGPEPAQPQLLTKFPRRRLDAEEIRDSMLAVSGRLDQTPGQEHPFQPWYQNRFNLNRPFHAEYATNRRSVYLMTQRLFRHSFLDLFDGPDPNSSTSQRTRASIPTQALYLMNSPFVAEQATAFAERLMSVAENDDERVRQLYRLAYGRLPERAESDSIATFLKQFRQRTSELNPARPENSRRSYVALCRSVLTSNEFFFVD